MERRQTRNQARHPAACGFSLVELLTVVAIIVLLIGILVPAVNKVRQTARNTATQATIGALSTGLETFRADQQIGGAYPPSASDYARGGLLQYTAMAPRAGGGGGGGASLLPEQISGAGLLTWALVGADQQGSPGFRTFRSGKQYWASDTDGGYDPGNLANCGAYALDDNRQPVHARVGPLVDLSKVELTAWDQNANRYEIALEDEARDAKGAGRRARVYPMFLDSFGAPILYWRADPAGRQIADRTPNDTGATVQRGVYHFLDNGPLLASGTYLGSIPSGVHQRMLTLRADSRPNPHNLVWYDGDDVSDPEGQLRGFAAYIRNKNATARVSPYKADSFLLVSPGADLIYGTADDIANFEHNGAELVEPE